MRYRLFIVLGIATAWSACNCGHTIGAPCSANSSCGPGLVCSSGHCAEGDGGTNGGGGANDGGDGGTGSDGGCVNLQCQQVSCPDGGTTTITGTVYDPAGNNPLYNAVVYVPNGAVQAFTPGLTCDRCGALTTGSPLVITLSGSDGGFTLTNVPTGSNIPLVVQIGRWRRQVTIPQVTACTNNALTDLSMTRLPQNQSEGDLPQMAIVTGGPDPMECLLRKIGVSDSEFTRPTGSGRVHFYVGDGGVNLSPPSSSGINLWTDAGTLANYDVVLLPCEGSPFPRNANELQNMVTYTSGGGRIFATHYSYTWTANNPAWTGTANWQPDPGQNSNPPQAGWPVTIDQSFPKGVSFAQWLVNVGASYDGGTPTPGLLYINEGRHNVWRANNPPSQAWMNGDFVSGGAQQETPHLTFNTPVNPQTYPDGGTAPQCGRVVFSDFHVSTTNARTPSNVFPSSCKDGGMTPQEKTLEFMIFDLSSCIQQDNTAPSVCQGLGQACSSSGICCAGMACLNPSGTACDGGTACSCNPSLN